jgi:hypothetical protein
MLRLVRKNTVSTMMSSTLVPTRMPAGRQRRQGQPAPSSTWSSSCYVLAGILYEVELVAGEQHGAAVAGPLPQGFRQAGHGHRVQAAERLVEGDDRRVMHQGR